MSKKYNRRNFLSTASCAALGSATFFSTLFNLQSMNAASIQNTSNVFQSDSEDYRALVCIMLGGGNDSFNMLAPIDNAHYNEYRATRTDQALRQNDFLGLNPLTFNQKQLGFHPAIPELKSLFDQQKLAVITNVGTLVQPTTRRQYDEGRNLPFALFSHADQDKQWLTSVPQSSSPTGWAGRLADLVQAANSNQNISMNISLAGKNLFQLGQESAEYSILPTGNGSIGIEGFGEADVFEQIKTSAVKSMLEKQYQDIFKQTYAEVVQASQNTHELFSSVVGNSQINTTFSNTELSQSLKMVARTIKVRQELGLKRQTFFVRFDGWDHHDELLNNQNQMLGILSKAMSEFQKALAEINVEDCVTTFTVSDFARTLVSNGNGTDHAWGGNVLVMGNKVKGGDVYGNYPSLSLTGNDLMLEGGVLIPQISTDEYFAELALWYGVAQSDLPTLFPNIGNFYSAMSSLPPIGFMQL